METATEEKVNVTFYRKSRHYPEEAIRVDEQSVRASISAWTMKIDAAMEKLRNGQKVSTRNFHFYGVIAE